MFGFAEPFKNHCCKKCCCMLLKADMGEHVGDVEFDEEEAVDDGANLGIKFN